MPGTAPSLGVTTLLVVAAVAVCWLLFVVAALYLDFKLGGWSSLATAYRHQKGNRDASRSWSLQTIILGRGSARYGGAVVVTATAEGLGLQMPFPFAWLYRPVLLPWKDATVVREHGLIRDVVTLTFAKVPDTPVQIYGELADSILNEVGLVWIEPSRAPAPPLPLSGQPLGK